MPEFDFAKGIRRIIAWSELRHGPRA